MTPPTIPHRAVTYPPGTYVCFRTSGFIAKCIRVMTQSRYNHAGIVVGTDQIVEARPSGASLGTITQYKDCLQAANDDEPITDEMRHDICMRALDLVGTPYGFLDILAISLTQFGVRWGWVTSRVADRQEMICSQLADEAYLRAGMHLFDDGRLPQDVTPGDLVDRVTRRVWALTDLT